jgi:FkbM family methyltransferase
MLGKYNPITILKSKIVRHIESKYKAQFADSKTIWSQYGEDIVISWLFLHKYNGFFVDIGAYHPKKISNTYWFYERGWRGINIEPNLDALKEFELQRPEDINVNAGVYNKEGLLTLYKFNHSYLNTLDAEVGEQRIKDGEASIEKIDVKVERLETILDKYANGREIDFLTIDVEGFDLEVLQSNNWEKYRPKIICVEDWMIDTEKYLAQSEKHKFLKSMGYVLVSKVIDSYIYSRVHFENLDDIKKDIGH